MPTPILEVVAEADEENVVAVDSADVVLDVEAAEVMIVMIAVKADSVVEEAAAVEDLVVEGVVEAVAATTATKKVILPENAPRVPLDPIKDEASLIYHKKVETVVAMADPNTKMGLLPETPSIFRVLM